LGQEDPGGDAVAEGINRTIKEEFKAGLFYFSSSQKFIAKTTTLIIRFGLMFPVIIPRTSLSAKGFPDLRRHPGAE
jgi:hypothetical protein